MTAGRYDRYHAVLQHIIFRRMLSAEDRALNLLLDERWSLPYLRALGIAHIYRRSFVAERLKRIHLFSYSRSGSHNFASRLHYLPGLFVFGEQAFTTPCDIWQNRIDAQYLKSVHLLMLSVFGPYGIQEKKGPDLDFLVFFNNLFLDRDGPTAEENLRVPESVLLFYTRNIFRVLYSRHVASERVGRDKSKWRITDESFERDIRRHRRCLLEILSLSEKFPDRVYWIFHEMFCFQPDLVFRQLFDWLGFPRKMHGLWNQPRSFFRHAFGHQGELEIRNNRLWCPVRKVYIQGGGGYNPLLEIDSNRCIADPIDRIITRDRLHLSYRILGQELTDFWLNDSNFGYDRVDRSFLINLAQSSLP